MVVVKLVGDLFAEIDLAGQVARCPFVFVDDGDRHIARVGIRVPVCDDAIPGVEAWQYEQRDDDQ